jgi:hypothetical protein
LSQVAQRALAAAGASFLGEILYSLVLDGSLAAGVNGSDPLSKTYDVVQLLVQLAQVKPG